MSDAEWVSLCFVADITMGQSPDSTFVNNQEIGLPFLQGCAEFGARHPLPKVYCNPPLRIAKNNSILISVRAPVGTANFSDQDYCIGRGLAAIKAKSGLAETMYLKYAIENNISFLHRRSQGSTFLAIGSTDLNEFKIPNLHINEQRKIAAILTIIDTAIEKNESLIAKYQKIKAGLMHDLFTRGVTADGKLRPPREQAPELYQETPVGWIPRDWSLRVLKNVYKNPIRDFGSFSSTNLITFLEDGIPFIKSEMIKEGEIDWETTEFISEKVHHLLQKSHVSTGNILFSKIGSALGKAVLYDGVRGVCNSNAAVAKIEVNERLALPQYIEAFMNSHFARQQFRLMIISLLPRINLGDIDKLNIQIPPIKEQQIICNHLLAATRKISSLKDETSKLRKQKYGLMQDLLTGKVPVKIDEPDQEFV